MALDRWIALVFLLICLVYGYTAFFTMDENIAPFMRRNPIWPSTFPKVLSIMGIVCALVVLLGLEKSTQTDATPDIDLKRIGEYKYGQALFLLGLMVVYALALRPAGFLLSTSVFLILGSLALGERRVVLTVIVAAIATGAVWYLVEGVLGIFLRPLPFFMGT